MSNPDKLNISDADGIGNDEISATLQDECADSGAEADIVSDAADTGSDIPADKALEGTDEYEYNMTESNEPATSDTIVYSHEAVEQVLSASGKDTKVKKKKKKASAHRKPKSEETETELFVPRKRPRSTALAIVFGVIKIMLVLIVVGGFAVLGLLLGVAKAYIDTTPTLDISTLTKSDRTSYIYDCNGNVITSYADMEYRDWASIDEFPDNLKNALISVEDVRFYKHGGLDLKRLFSAVINTLRNTNTHGGSTITQQLIKNKVLSNVQSYKRKIQEAYLAYELESTVSKDTILEAYMNDVYLGDSNYGFKTAAKDYFGKELDELTIRECAMLAGMVQKPNYTNPRANTYKRFYEDGTNKMDITNARTDVVLKAMYEAGAITLDEYNAALAEEVTILEVSSQKQLYDMAYFVEYGIYDVVNALLEVRGLDNTSANRALIESELRTGGYHIYLTVDPDIQHSVQDILTNWDNYPALRDSSAGIITDSTSGLTIIQPQASVVIIDHETGQLKAIIGGRNEPTQKRQLNRAYQSSMPVGSSIKPLSVYGPALDLGYSPALGILNSEVEIEGYGGRGYPSLGSSSNEGIKSMRKGLVSSLNIVAARLLYDYVSPEISVQYLTELGINPSRIHATGSGLALGTSDISPLEMAAAYACIANGGVYIDPVSFTRVVDDKGNTILEATDVQTSHRVFKESTAYMLIDLLTDAVQHGTGRNAQIEGITVAGKTGTNNDYTSVYFAGFTGYYTASLWIGHDQYSEKLASGSTGSSAAAPLWQAFMSQIHEGLPDKPIMDASPGDLGLVQVCICPISGQLATEACMLDATNKPITDWCRIEDVPTTYCSMHCCVDICSESGKLACEHCPSDLRREGYVVLIPTASVYAKLSPEKLRELIPNAVVTDLDISSFIVNYLDFSEYLCPIHDYGSSYDNLADLYLEAGSLINTVQDYLANVQTLGDSDRAMLLNNIANLQAALAQADPSAISLAIQLLTQNYNVLYAQYPPVSVPSE
ncbi:MAG: transglycosylase domain-containing protein [Eubacteriales bacterium]|nr:transglycosylase domain-containing protein [Eubacteriales bacterium]